MLTLIKGAEVFAPESIGQHDILIANNKIAAVEKSIDLECEFVKVIDGTNKIATPGFIDSLVHIIGGGGEGGFTTRTPEVQLTDLTLAGITTLVAALGTDSITRSLESMLAKAKELNRLGVTCHIYSGSYHVPIKTITDSLQKDICLIEECIGVGEVALADHRGSQIDYQQLSYIASDARVGGMLSSKSGIVSIHMGDGRAMFERIYEVVEKTDLPISQFYPTHINRSQQLLDAGLKYCEKGGVIDLTTSSTPTSLKDGEIKCSRALAYFLEQGGDIRQITFSSDGHASLPEFDQAGNLTALSVGYETSLFREVKDAVIEENVPLEVALQTITTSPAAILGLKEKGKIDVGYDADINLLDAESLDIDTVIAKGRAMVSEGNALVRGRFE